MSEIKEYECPNCGGRLQFDANIQELKCPFCDGTFDVDSFQEAKGFTICNEQWDNSGLLTYTCNSCGGVVMADEHTAATSCPYCGDPLIISGKLSGVYKPSRIIPFKLDKEAAKKAYSKYISKKVLLPKTFSDEAIIDEIKGIYVPFWLFNGTSYAKIWFDATRVRTWSDRNYHYRETKMYKLYRAGKVSFSNIPVDASNKIDDSLSQSVEPFNIEQANDFNENYLVGFMADKYDVESNDSVKIATKRIENSTLSLFSTSTSSFSTCVPSSSNISVWQGQQEYVMYPMWLLNVKYKDKNYSFAMNGQTGKFVGNLPADNKKLLFIIISVFLTVFLLSLFIQYLVLK